MGRDGVAGHALITQLQICSNLFSTQYPKSPSINHYISHEQLNFVKLFKIKLFI